MAEQTPERSRIVSWEDPKLAARRARSMSGTEFFEAMQRGEIPPPPFGQLLGIDLFEVAEGRFLMTRQPQECHYNPMGCVHGGILATLLDSVMSAAVHTALPAGRGYITLEVKVNFLRPVTERTGEVMAEGKVVSCGRQIATAEGRILAKGERAYATGSATCLIFDTAEGTPERL